METTERGYQIRQKRIDKKGLLKISNENNKKGSSNSAKKNRQKELLKVSEKKQPKGLQIFHKNVLWKGVSKFVKEMA